MQRITLFGLPAVVAGLATITACDRQVGTDYQGESLLRIRGSVTIPSEFKGHDLVPAIEFRAQKRKKVDDGYDVIGYNEVMEVDVKGEFPSNFTVDFFDPPPAEAMYNNFLSSGEVEGDLPYAVGNITVVARSFPKKVNFFPRRCEQDPTNDLCYENFTCPIDGSWGQPEPEDIESGKCFEQTISCLNDSPTPQLRGCTVLKSGGDRAMTFAGYAQNIGVVYFSAPVPAATSIAYEYNDGDAISAGYHLYRIGLTAMEECSARQLKDPSVECSNKVEPPLIPKCVTQAESVALDRYNKKHGTSLTQIELTPPYSCYGANFASVPCDALHAPPDEEVWEYERIIREVMKENHCSYHDPRNPYTPIDDPDATPISIELGTISPYSSST